MEGVHAIVESSHCEAKDGIRRHCFKEVGEFFNLMKERFAMIDIKKNQRSLSKKQIADINITDEIKIITTSDKVHNLWKEVISSQT